MTQNLPMIPYDQVERMAVAIAKSGLFGLKNQEQAVALMLLAQAEGMHPVIAARDFHIVQGRPALKADAMLARFLQSGGKVAWNTYTDQAVSGTFSHPQGGSVTVEWTIAQAKAANLTGKDVWRQYPRAMLRARVISEGIRTVFPGVAVGVYTPEEVEQFDDKPEQKTVVKPTIKAESKEVENVIVQAAPPAPSPAEMARKPLYAKIKASGWTSDQLKDYCTAAYGLESAKDLSIEELTELSDICSQGTYSAAADALLAKGFAVKEDPSEAGDAAI